MRKISFLIYLALTPIFLNGQILEEITSFDGNILRSVPILKEAENRGLKFNSNIAGFESFIVYSEKSKHGPAFFICGSSSSVSIFCGKNEARDEWSETDYSTLKRVDDFYVIIEEGETEKIYWRDKNGHGYFMVYNEFGPIIFNGENYSLMSEDEVKAMKKTMAEILEAIRGNT